MLADLHPAIIVGEVHDACQIGLRKLDPSSDGVFGCHNFYIFFYLDATKGARMFSTNSLANRSLEYFS